MTEQAATRLARSALTRIYRSTGVFYWFERLRRAGVISPVRGVYIIGRCLADAPSHGLPESEEPKRVNEWVGAMLESGLRRFTADALVPLSDLGKTVAQTVAEWDPFEELAELMAVECSPYMLRTVRHQFRSKGIAIDYPQLHDLAALFANRDLRGALRSFDPSRGEGKEGAWLSTVFYRYALRHVLTSRRLHESFSLAFEVPASASSPDEVLESRAREQALVSLAGALEALPRMQRVAVELYFGMGDREHTLDEVARALKTSPYFARTAVTSGVGAIAAVLGVTGLIDANELRLARAMFVEGRDVEGAAASLGLKPSDVRRSAARIGAKLRTSLRTRTRPVRNIPTVTEVNMLASHEVNTSSHDQTIAEFVRRMAHRQEIEYSVEEGERVARWPGQDQALGLAEVRNWLEYRPESLDMLLEQAGGDDLAKLFALDATDRHDLPPDSADLETLLDAASSRSLANASTLHDIWIEQAKMSGLELTAEDRQGAEQRIRDSLSAVTAALEEDMPWKIRVDGKGLLRVPDQHREQTNCLWILQDGEERRRTGINLLELLRHRLELVGRFRAEALDLLATCANESLARRSIVLPGFTSGRQKGNNDDVLLEWRPPILGSDT